MGVRGIPRRFRFPWRSTSEIRREVDEELRFHLDMRIEELRREGLDAAQAEREAVRRFGDLRSTRRELRALDRKTERKRRFRMIWDELRHDAKTAWRSLVRRPGFSALAILVLALGIGANSTMFSLADTILAKPLRIEDPDELVGLYNRDTEEPDQYRSFSYPTFRDLRAADGSFSDLAAFTITMVGRSQGETTRRLMAALVSSGYFDAFGVPPAQGRGFTEEEEQPGAEIPVAVVSHAFWQRAGGDDDFLGSTLELNGRQVTVVGIAAEGFSGSTAIFSPEIWLPLGMYGLVHDEAPEAEERPLAARDQYALMLFGRLEDGVSMDEARPRLEQLAENLASRYPETRGDLTFELAPLPRLGLSNTPESEDALLIPVTLLLALSGVVLLIACLDLTNMFLARGESRRSEIAVRAALGGGRLRLVRQQLGEGFLLSLAGGAAGLLLAWWATRFLFSSIRGALPFGVAFVFDPVPDLRVILATLGFCMLATLLFALMPAWRQTGGDVFDGLRDQSHSPSGAGRAGPFLSLRGLLVVSQLALSMVLLTAAGLFVRGSLEAAHATPGFSLERSLLVELDSGLLGYDEDRSRRLYREVADRLGALPGVESVGLASLVPFGSVTHGTSVRSPGEPEEAAVSAVEYAVGGRYFESLRLPILAGRPFRDDESWSADGPPVAIVDRPLAEKLWPGEDPVGRRVQPVVRGPAEAPEPMEVVGVVPGVLHRFSDEEPRPHLYVPFGSHWHDNAHFHLRLDDSFDSAAAQSATLRAVRQEIREIDPRLPVLALGTLLDHRDESVFVWLVNTAARVFAGLGALALFLALVGVYGVKAYLTSRRTREIGIRMSLGASSRTVTREMMRSGLSLTLAGLAIGTLLAVGVARLLGSMLYEVSPGDPLVFAAAATLLLASALLAAWIPVRRACRIDPTEALRHE